MNDGVKLPLNALRAFEAVAAHLSFTGAAQSLNVTTAAVSSHIKSLEEFLETPLFVRHSRSVRLTPQGARCLPHLLMREHLHQSNPNSTRLAFTLDQLA